jgi:predicted dehydrogenase
MTIRIGVVGGGTFGEMHLQAFSQLARDGRCEFASLADTNADLCELRARQNGVKTYASHREMLAKERLDGVTIATPDPTHLPIALDALEAGCHVLVEKPMDVTEDGCRRMMEAARSRGLILQVDFHKRLDPYHQALRKALADGRLGTPLYGYAWMEDRIEVPTKWFPAWAPQSSPAWFLGSHMIDLFRWLVGGPRAVRVYATGSRGKLRDLGVDTWDSLQAKIDFDGGFALSLDTSWVLPQGFEAVVNQGIRLVGTEGIMEVDSQNRGAEACFGDATQQTLNLGFTLKREDKWGTVRYEGYGYESITDLVDNIAFLKSGGSLPQLKGKYPDGEDGLEVTRVICAIHESAVSHRLVELQGD